MGMEHLVPEAILREAERIMSLTTEAESRLIKQIDRLSDIVERMSGEFTRMSSKMDSIVEKQEAAKEFGTRLTKLEVQADMHEEWRKSSRENTKWAVGLAVGAVMAVIGMAITMFLHWH